MQGYSENCAMLRKRHYHLYQHYSEIKYCIILQGTVLERGREEQDLNRKRKYSFNPAHLCKQG